MIQSVCKLLSCINVSIFRFLIRSHSEVTLPSTNLMNYELIVQHSIYYNTLSMDIGVIGIASIFDTVIFMLITH